MVDEKTAAPVTHLVASDPNIIKRCTAALQAKYILSDDECRGMTSIVLAVAGTLSIGEPRRPAAIDPRFMSIDRINETITALEVELARRANFAEVAE